MAVKSLRQHFICSFRAESWRFFSLFCRETLVICLTAPSLLYLRRQKTFSLLEKSSAAEEAQELFSTFCRPSLLHFLNPNLLLQHSVNVASAFNTTCNFPLFCRIPFDLVTLDSPFALGPTGFASGRLETAPPYRLSSFSAGPPWNRGGSNCFFHAAQCGLASSQSETCLHSVIDSVLASCQPIGSLAVPKPRVLTLCFHI